MIEQKKIVMTVLVFKTNIRFKKDVAKVATCLQRDKGINKWNVDLEDIDKVLRVETNSLTAKGIINSIRRCGYECDELPG